MSSQTFTRGQRLELSFMGRRFEHRGRYGTVMGFSRGQILVQHDGDQKARKYHPGYWEAVSETRQLEAGG